MILTIIVVNWNARNLLEQCLQSIQMTLEGSLLEVIVVDNASRDDSVEMVRSRFPQTRLILNRENAGFARANNQAIAESCGRYILLLNSDAFLTGNAVQSMVNQLDEHQQVGIVGANLFFQDGKPQLSHGPLPSLQQEVASLLGLDKLLLHTLWKISRKTGQQAVETGTVSGACLMVRRSVLDQIGLLDEKFFFFGEEVDFCRRAQQAGWKVVHLPDAHVIHIGGGTTGLNAGRYLMLYREKLRYFNKHHSIFARSILLSALWVTTLVKLLGYLILRWISLGRVRKDRLWFGIARGLVHLNGRI